MGNDAFYPPRPGLSTANDRNLDSSGCPRVRRYNREAAGPRWAQGRRPGPEKKRLDQIQFTEPRRATPQLLRERILENTRVVLDLPDNYTGPRFITREVERAGLFVNRLLSDQNLLASRRGGDWSPEQIRDALETGMTLGMAETLEILFELDELDETSWALVCDILDAFHRKVESAC